MAKIAIESDVCKGVVEYMQGVDTMLAKRAAAEDMLATEGANIVNALVTANIVPETTKAAAAAKLQQDPAYAVELLQKMAEALQVPAEAGAGTDAVKSAGVALTPDEAFERELTK